MKIFRKKNGKKAEIAPLLEPKEPEKKMCNYCRILVAGEGQYFYCNRHTCDFRTLEGRCPFLAPDSQIYCSQHMENVLNTSGLFYYSSDSEDNYS